MIQMNPAKIEIYRSKRTVFYKEEINITARKYGIGPRPFSFSVHEIKVRIETRYAANVAPKSDLIQLGSAHELERRLNRALDVLAVHTWCLGTGIKWCCVHTLST